MNMLFFLLWVVLQLFRFQTDVLDRPAHLYPKQAVQNCSKSITGAALKGVRRAATGRPTTTRYTHGALWHSIQGQVGLAQAKSPSLDTPSRRTLIPVKKEKKKT